jgi:hypothetical protein
VCIARWDDRASRTLTRPAERLQSLLYIRQGRRYGRGTCGSADIALEALGGQKESLRLLNCPLFTLVHATSLLLLKLHGYGSKAADLAHADLSAGSSSGVDECFELLDEYVDLELAGADR